MTENFPNLANDKVTQVQEAERAPVKMNPKRPTPRHIIIKMQKVKDKERILNLVEKSRDLPTRSPIRLSADFSKDTVQARMDWQEVFKVMKTRTYNLAYSIQQSYHLEWKGGESAFQTR